MNWRNDSPLSSEESLDWFIKMTDKRTNLDKTEHKETLQHVNIAPNNESILNDI